MSTFLIFIFVIVHANLLWANVTVADGTVVVAQVKASQEGINYQVKWPEGLAPEIQDRMESVSLLIEHKSRLPGSFGGLIKRVEKDKELLIKTLHSFGYYGCAVDVDYDLNEPLVVIKFSADLGPVYTVEHIELDNRGKLPLPEIAVTLSELIGLDKGDNLTAEHAHRGIMILKRYFTQSGFPFVEVEEPEASIDHKKHSVVLFFPINLGGQAIIVGSEIEASKDLDNDFIRNRLLWKNGDTFDSRVVEKTRRLLSQTGLFNNVVVTPKAVDANSNETELKEKTKEQPVIMDVKTTLAPPRSISAGLHYATSRGGEARFAWNHYNLLGHGENLGASLRYSKVRSKARIFYDIPDFGAPKQTLKNDSYIMRENTRAYSGKTIAVSSRIECQFDNLLKASGGLSGEHGHIRSCTTNIRSPIRLIGVPLELGIDASNDLLNPTRGFRLNGHVTPYIGKLGNSKDMLISMASGSFYLPFETNSLDEDMGTIACFAKFGVVNISDYNNLPPNKRFYGGGNGSVRGYGYQLISPVDNNRIPLGGQSLLEFGSELRYRFTEKVGGVIFIEAGCVSKYKIPTKAKLLWGTGFGIRYYTEYAPVRLDIAFPLQRRKIAGNKRPYDHPYQFYVSVGQAF